MFLTSIWNAPVKDTISEKQTENNTTKKSAGIGAWLYVILVAIVAMIIGLIVSIKSLFTAKSKANAQKEKFYKEPREGIHGAENCFYQK